MLIPCTILVSFPYSTDGFTTRRAEAGKVAHIPAELVEGLAQADYLHQPNLDEMQGKALGPSPENKMLPGAPESKHPLDHDGDGRPGGSLPAVERDVCDELRAEYERLTGSPADRRWGETRLRDEIAAAGG